MSRRPVVLVVGGTDPLAGAGVVADALHVAAHDAWPLVVATAEVRQDSTGVQSFAAHDAEDVAARLALALADGRPDAVKIGMLASPAIADVVRRTLVASGIGGVTGPQVVVDPVLAGGSDGTALATTAMPDAIRALAADTGALLTPNGSELGALWRRPVPTTAAELEEAARSLAEEPACRALLKGGHVTPVGGDWIVADGACRALPAHAWVRTDVHGTGCALSTAIACRLASGAPLFEAVRGARAWMAERVRTHTAPVGRGRWQFVPTAVSAPAGE